MKKKELLNYYEKRQKDINELGAIKECINIGLSQKEIDIIINNSKDYKEMKKMLEFVKIGTNLNNSIGYAKDGYNFEQVEVMNQGEKLGVSKENSKVYKNPLYSAGLMKECIFAFVQGVPRKQIQKFLESSKDKEQLKQLRRLYKTKLTKENEIYKDIIIDKITESNCSTDKIKEYTKLFSNNDISPHDIGFLVNNDLKSHHIQFIAESLQFGLDMNKVKSMVNENASYEHMVKVRSISLNNNLSNEDIRALNTVDTINKIEEYAFAIKHRLPEEFTNILVGSDIKENHKDIIKQAIDLGFNVEQVELLINKDYSDERIDKIFECVELNINTEKIQLLTDVNLTDEQLDEAVKCIIYTNIKDAKMIINPEHSPKKIKELTLAVRNGLNAEQLNELATMNESQIKNRRLDMTVDKREKEEKYLPFTKVKKVKSKAKSMNINEDLER